MQSIEWKKKIKTGKDREMLVWKKEGAEQRENAINEPGDRDREIYIESY